MNGHQTCWQCGGDFEQRGPGAAARYCSKACKYEANQSWFKRWIALCALGFVWTIGVTIVSPGNGEFDAMGTGWVIAYWAGLAPIGLSFAALIAAGIGWLAWTVWTGGGDA